MRRGRDAGTNASSSVKGGGYIVAKGRASVLLGQGGGSFVGGAPIGQHLLRRHAGSVIACELIRCCKLISSAPGRGARPPPRAPCLAPARPPAPRRRCSRSRCGRHRCQRRPGSRHGPRRTARRTPPARPCVHMVEGEGGSRETFRDWKRCWKAGGRNRGRSAAPGG